ncbi:PAS domain-containing protein [Sphingomonas aerophila]|uniref:PAS domain-containing protein n=1 Tax=Sphingomonas aerophila TaxID=1344948 RepID=A0A7W9BFY2_9SPHN|nr:hypothetical protein [Sphingomonas aerophila]MBB5716432.1 hypothetical protein [Sphingomonas aerophila]
MNIARGFEDAIDGDDLQLAHEAADAGIEDAMFDLGGDERRMHVRAYNHWVSLLKGRAYPAIADLDPDSIVDFGAHSVLLDFSAGIEDPSIAYLGRALREECGLALNIHKIADVPSRSLLSRLTDHYLQIIANCAPIGFEAEFVGTRGRTTLYRGILMPFSSTGDTIDFIYGVINWKETVDLGTQAGLDAELDASVRAGPKSTSDAPIWADGPSAGFDEATLEALAAQAGVDDDEDDRAAPGEAPTSLVDPMMTGSLADCLSMARESAAAVRAADTRSRAALYRALARAHDFGLSAAADPEGFAELAADAGVTIQARAPLTPVVKLVFGADYDKTRLTEFAAVLSHARRHDIGAGGLGAFLDSFPGGIKGVVAAEREAKRPAPAAKPPRPARAPIAHVAFDLPGDTGETVVLVARIAAGGGFDLLGTSRDASLADRALRAID